MHGHMNVKFYFYFYIIEAQNERFCKRRSQATCIDLFGLRRKNGLSQRDDIFF